MLLVVDANAIVARPLLVGSAWDEIRAAVTAGSIDLVVPELAVLEAVAVFHRAHEVKITQIRKLLRKSSRTVGERLQTAIKALEVEQSRYEELLRGSLGDVGAEVVSMPSVSHETLTAAAIARRAPFDEDGGGYRDALHWHALLEATEFTEMPEVVLVSADARAFGKSRSADLLAQLSSINSDVTLRVVPSVEAVEIPGLFTGSIDMFDDQLERQLLVRIADHVGIGGDVSELLDPDSEFDSAEIRELGHFSIDSAKTREYYATRDLQIRFECSAQCLIALTAVQIDEDTIDYREVRHLERWVVTWSGEAFTSERGSLITANIELRPSAMEYIGEEYELRG